MSVPVRIGRYEIVGLLATGGMAEILLGRLRGPSGFERAVVVKRILPHLARQDAFTTMFLDEARIVAGIRHPNVVHVHELIQSDGELALIMEYLEGESVAAIQRRLVARGERMELDVVAHVIAETCAGLHAAHELVSADGTPQKIVHRDVSPQNIFVGYDGQVKLLDFGIAKAASHAGRTKTGQLKGKFEYMSPEQCNGEPLDRRSDIFSLGVVAYELSTGRRLFKRDSELAILRAVTQEEITRPSQVIAGYPKALEDICLKALARNRSARPATAAMMRRDLMAIARAGGGDLAPGEKLVELMKTLFTERAEEKREMLRRVSAGSPLGSIPESEPDARIELPVVMRDDEAGATRADATLESLSTGAARVASRRRAAQGSAIGVVAFLAGALALIGLERGFRTRSASPPAPTQIAAAADVSATEPPSLPADAASAAAPHDAREIVVRIATTPPGANVVVERIPRGTTPVDVVLPRSNSAARVELALRGFAPSTETIVADRDRTIDRALVPLGGATTAQRPQATATPAPAPAPAPAPVAASASAIPFWE